MNKKISVIGGDKRSVILAMELAKDGNDVCTYGLEDANELEKCAHVKKCDIIDKAIDNSDVIIGPIPFSTDKQSLNTKYSKNKIRVEEFCQKKYNKKVVIAGNVKTELILQIEQNGGKFFDVLKREELAVLNAISTAEGTLEIAIHETDKTIHNSNVLILGFGRTGKVLARVFNALGAKVYCEARKQADIAWIKTYGYNAIELNSLIDSLYEFDIIINTIPYMVLNKEKLDRINLNCLIIDIASTPGGIDRDYANEKNIKFHWALAIPGKIAPITTAQYLKDTIYNILNEI